MKRATRTFVIGTRMGDRIVHGGTELPDNDPAVKGFPDAFEDVPEEPKPTAKRRRANG